MGNVLVYGEHAHDNIPKATGVAIAAGKAITAKQGGDVILAVLASDVGALGAAAAIATPVAFGMLPCACSP